MIFRRNGFMILADMLISVMIISLCTLTIFKSIEIINVRRHESSDIIKLRNEITQSVTSKRLYVRNNNLTPLRSYQISDELMVYIYQIVLNDEIKTKYGFENIEFGLISKRTGE